MENKQKEVFIALRSKNQDETFLEEVVLPVLGALNLKGVKAIDTNADDIRKDTFNLMKNCDYYIAIITPGETGINLNVMFEIGYLKALEKRGCILGRNIPGEKDLPFYLKNSNAINCQTGDDEIEIVRKNLKDQLEARIKEG